MASSDWLTIGLAGSWILLPLLPVTLFCLFVALKWQDWQVCSRLFLLFGVPILVLGLLAYLATKLPFSIASALPIGYALMLVIIGVRVTWFLLNLRRAGALVIKDSAEFQTNALLAILLFILWSIIAILDRNYAQALAFLLIWATVLINQAISTFEVRENGIMRAGSLLAWDRMTSVTWVDNLRKDTLRIVLKGSPKEEQILVPFQLRGSLDAYLKSRSTGETPSQ